MNKNQIWHSITSSIAAGIVTFFILEFSKENWEFSLKIGIIIFIGIFTFIIAFLTGKKNKEKQIETLEGIEIGSNLVSNGIVEISDVDVDDSSRTPIKIGTNIDAGENVKISGIKVNTKEQSNG